MMVRPENTVWCYVRINVKYVFIKVTDHDVDAGNLLVVTRS